MKENNSQFKVIKNLKLLGFTSKQEAKQKSFISRWREEMLKHHPDKNIGNKDAEEKSKQINNAKQELTEVGCERVNQYVESSTEEMWKDGFVPCPTSQQFYNDACRSGGQSSHTYTSRSNAFPGNYSSQDDLYDDWNIHPSLFPNNYQYQQFRRSANDFRQEQFDYASPPYTNYSKRHFKAGTTLEEEEDDVLFAAIVVVLLLSISFIRMSVSRWRKWRQKKANEDCKPDLSS